MEEQKFFICRDDLRIYMVAIFGLSNIKLKFLDR